MRNTSAIAIVAAVLCGECLAGNLVQNPTFDTGIAGWNFAGSCYAPFWDSFASNGALAIDCFPAASVGTASQCVAVPHTDLDFSAQVTNNGMAGPVSFGLVAHANADCTGAATTLLDPAGATVVPDDRCCGVTWTAFARADLPVPAGARSVSLEIVVTNPADVALDDIHLGASVFQNGFDQNGFDTAP